MNLYLISATRVSKYDSYDSAVVVAESAEAACRIHPDGRGRALHNSHSWVSKPEDVLAILLGPSTSGLKAGSVVCASFNAG